MDRKRITGPVSDTIHLQCPGIDEEHEMGISVEQSDAYIMPQKDTELSALSKELAQLDLLKTPTPTGFEAMTRSTSTNTDICILEASESLALEVTEGEIASNSVTDYHNCAVDDLHAFTVLHTPLAILEGGAHDFNESTEVLLIHSENETPPGTDSDVEVLNCEEILDTDWATHSFVAAIETPELNYDVELNYADRKNDDTQDMTRTKGDEKSLQDIDATTKQQTACNGGSGSTHTLLYHTPTRNSQFDHLSRADLLRIIGEQEATILRYRYIQQRLFAEVDVLNVLRTEFNAVESND